MRTMKGRVGSRAPVRAEAVLPRRKVAERLVREEEVVVENPQPRAQEDLLRVPKC